MATRTADNPAFHLNTAGTRQELFSRLVDGAATFYMGQFVRLANDGLLYEGTTSTASGVGDDKIDYIAAEDHGTASAGGVDTVRVEVFKVNVNDRYIMNELDGTVTAAMEGMWYPLDVTSNVCTVDTATADTHAVFNMVNPLWRVEPYTNNSADTLAKVIVSPLARTMDAVSTN